MDETSRRRRHHYVSLLVDLDRPQAVFCTEGRHAESFGRFKRDFDEPQTLRQASRRVTDLLAAWRDANPQQRARLAASIVSEIQVTDGRIRAIRPRGAWPPTSTSYCTMERETSLELFVE